MRRLISIISILIFYSSFLNSQIRIRMQEENGVYTTPCTVNGLRLSFIFDTGASNVSISLFEALFMLKNGYLNESDLTGSSYAQIADGNIVENTTVNLREMDIGGLKLYDIKAVIIHELSAPVLLGQSAIQKLGMIQLEGDELIIMQPTSQSAVNNCGEAQNLASKANNYSVDELYTLAAETYQKAYDLCPDAIDCYNMFLMGNSFFNINIYAQAIKYLEKAKNCELNKEISSQKDIKFYLYLNVIQKASDFCYLFINIIVVFICIRAITVFLTIVEIIIA